MSRRYCRRRCPFLDVFFFFSSRRRHTRWPRDWSSDVCSSDLIRYNRGAANRAPSSEAVDETLPIVSRLDELLGPTACHSRLANLVCNLAPRCEQLRSEERRVGKECRCRWSQLH